MNRNLLIGLVVASLLLALGLFLYNQSKSQSTPADTEVAPVIDSTPSSAPSSESTSSAAPAREIIVTGSPFKFDPATIKVKNGETIKIVFKNAKGMHDFTINELNVKTPVIQAGQDSTVEFTASKTGSFEYYCSVGNHRDQGMKGTLIVE